MLYFYCNFIIVIIIIKNESALQTRREYEHSSNPKSSTITNPWKEKKEKIVGDKKIKQIKPIGKHRLCS